MIWADTVSDLILIVGQCAWELHYNWDTICADTGSDLILGQYDRYL